MNFDKIVNTHDIASFVQAILIPDGYAAAMPHCDIVNADVNRDGSADGRDCQMFIEILVK